MPTRSSSMFTILFQTVIALVIVLFFACFGDAQGSLTTAMHSMGVLIKDTVTGTHLYEQYWTVTPTQTVDSVRLIVMAFVFALLLGCYLAFARVRIKSPVLRGVTDTITSVLESMPEAMYIMIVVVITLLFLSVGVVIPAFSVGLPKWSETFIPAFALCLPGAFYLQRILSLQMRDELGADYTRTASSKGASERRIFYRHVVPNLGSTLLRQLPVIAALILSSAIFAEFFLEYPAALFIFSNFATGWNYSTGIPLTTPKPSELPEFQHGLVFVIGASMVLVWVLLRLITHVIHRIRYAGDNVATSPHGQVHRLRRPSLIIGVIMVCIVIVVGIDPHLITHAKPFHLTAKQVYSQVSLNYSPSPGHPFGTDGLKRDLLLETASSTFRTLYPIVLITILTIAASLVVAVLAYGIERTWLRTALRYLGESLAGVPVLYILFLALYTKNIHSSSQWLVFILWVAAAEAGRGAYAFLRQIQTWNQFVFIEGATSIGRSKFGTLFTHLRSWLGYYTLEYGFTEFARVMTIMAQLAAFHIYISEKMGFLPFDAPTKGIIATQQTWVSMIGDATAGMMYTMAPNIIYAPVLFIVFTVVGVNLIARGIRG